MSVPELDAAAKQDRLAAPSWPDHPVVCTFAAKLPFPLRLTDGGVHQLDLVPDYVDPELGSLFPGRPFVRIRICNAPTGGFQYEPLTTSAALRSLYGSEVPGLGEPLGDAYDQWVSLETPSPRLVGEATNDLAYCFHRCLRVLDLFLRSHNLVFHDSQVHPLATQELSPVVLVGEYQPRGGTWTYKFPMLVHPMRVPVFVRHDTRFGTESAALAWGVNQLIAGNPFTRSMLLVMRADRAARIRGDQTDVITSLQTAMESRLYATWRMLLVDNGLTAAEIGRRLGAETPYKSLLLSILPRLLGGQWDATARGTPVGDYWQKLYQLRNRVIHAGYEPSPPEGDAARVAFDGFRHFIRDRLWERRAEYPRAALVTIGRDGMSARNWTDPRFDARVRAMLAEPAPFFLPWDSARRPPHERSKQGIHQDASGKG